MEELDLYWHLQLLWLQLAACPGSPMAQVEELEGLELDCLRLGLIEARSIAWECLRLSLKQKTLHLGLALAIGTA